MKRLTFWLVIGLLSLTEALAGDGKLDREGGRVEKASIKLEGQSNVADYPALAKIRLTKAVDIALRKTSGQPLAVSLVKARGYLVYRVLVVSNEAELRVVDIDAGNGRILLSRLDDGDDDDNGDDDDDDNKDDKDDDDDDDDDGWLSKFNPFNKD